MSELIELLKSNPYVAPVLTVMLGGLTTFLLIKLPKNIFTAFIKQLTTSMTYNNTSSEEVYEAINSLMYKASNQFGSRVLTIISNWDAKARAMHTKLDVGYGTHFLFYKGKFLRLTKTRSTNNVSSKVKEECTITYFGRSHAFFNTILDDSANLQAIRQGVHIFKPCTNLAGWDYHKTIEVGGLDALALDSSIKAQFTEIIRHFKNNKDVYKRLNIPYKITIMLHGEPGSGKTSLIRHLATEFSLSLCELNLSYITDIGFETLLQNSLEQSIILLEDFDCTSGSQNRATTSSNGESKTLTLNTILNTLDGAVGLDGTIIFLTTNYINRIDDAIYRAGRVDLCVELPRLTPVVVQDYFEKLYPLLKNSKVPYCELRGCDINAVAFFAKEDSKKVKEWFENRNKEVNSTKNKDLP